MKAKKKAGMKKCTDHSLPATGRATDLPHVARAMRGCACIQCGHHRTLERRAERAWAIAKRFENEPMVGEAVWHEHHKK